MPKSDANDWSVFDEVSSAEEAVGRGVSRLRYVAGFQRPRSGVLVIKEGIKNPTVDTFGEYIASSVPNPEEVLMSKEDKRNGQREAHDDVQETIEAIKMVMVVSDDKAPTEHQPRLSEYQLRQRRLSFLRSNPTFAQYR
jgi:hypothetical protein